MQHTLPLLGKKYTSLWLFSGLIPAILFHFALSIGGDNAEARNMHARFGLGYNSQFNNSTSANKVPALSFKYGLTRDIAAALVIGGRTSEPLNSVTAIKFFKNIFYETSLNFYFMIAGGILNAGNGAGSEFLFGFGSEFFIPGIESLGFSVETGLSFTNAAGGSFLLQTMGVSFLDAGIHFYF